MDRTDAAIGGRSPGRRPRLLATCLVALVLAVLPSARGGARGSSFAGLIEQLSEPGGYFDTDNLVSNERSYLHVVPGLRQAGVKGGAYIGVGPDQNFSYIAAIRPSIAFIVDVRRDNLLLQVLLKALFALAETRVEYLALLVGKAAPADPSNWQAVPIDRIVSYIDDAPSIRGGVAALRSRVDAAIAAIGVPLSPADLQTIDRFHRTFINEGLSLRFQSTGRSPRSYYPNYRELLLETDREGHHENYLASEDAFRFVRGLQGKDLVVPVVGDISGTHALAAIAKLLASRGERLSAFYTSNVEFYLFQSNRFAGFVENLSRMPRDERSVIIRAIFVRPWGAAPPESVAGYASASLVRPVRDLVDGYARGGFRNDRDLASLPASAGTSGVR